MTRAKDHPRLDAELAQEALLDDPGFLRDRGEDASGDVGGTDDRAHIGAVPCERS